MATAINSPFRQHEIKLETNRPQTFALKFATGKEVGQWGNVMFTAIDDRRLFLHAEDANEFEHSLLEINYQPAEFIRVTRVKHGTARGGGFSIRVERVEDAATAREPQRATQNHSSLGISREEALLERSVEMAQTSGAEAFRAQVAKTVAAAAPAAPHNLTASFTAAIDAIHAAQAYAAAKGLKVTFTSEDVRACAISAFIAAERAALGARY